jgi:hypothetical protein
VRGLAGAALPSRSSWRPAVRSSAGCFHGFAIERFDAPPAVSVYASRDLTNEFGGSSIRRIRQRSEPRGMNTPASVPAQFAFAL